MAFSSGEAVKKCIVSRLTTRVGSIPKSIEINAAKSVTLSSGTVARVTDLIADQVKQKTLLQPSECSYFF